MPLYDFICKSCGKVTEERQGFDVDIIPCRCGSIAQRAGVYKNQYIQAETGPVGGKKNEPPSSDINLRQPFAEYVEASEEIDYHYAKAEANGQKVKKADTLNMAKARVKKQSKRK